MTDQQIIQLIQQNKHSNAFTRLYRYFTPVQKLILSRGGSKDDAKDVFMTWFPLKNVSVTAAYVDLGNLVSDGDQTAWYISGQLTY